MKLFDLTGKTAFITGAAGLLGRRHAEAILELGGDVVVADINLDLAKKACEQLEGTAIPMQVDVNSRTSIQNAVDNCEKIDILINNAAKDPKVGSLSNETMFETMTEEFWKDGIETILNGTFLCSQIVINKMLSQGGGVVLNIASDLGVIAPDQRIYEKDKPKPITYSAAKWGVIGMTKYLATYFADKNIRVNSLSPAGVFNGQSSQFVDKLTNLIPMGRMAEADEYKGAIAFLCSDASSYMTGTNLIIDGGRTSW